MAQTVDVPGVRPGESAMFILRVWLGGSAFDPAGTRSESAPFVVANLGGDPGTGVPPLIPSKLNGMQAFLAFPEPSTLALGLVGRAAILLCRRR